MNKKQKRSAAKNKNQDQIRQNRLKRELVRIGEYLISGGLYFWSGYAIFFVCDHMFGWNLWWAKLTANVFGWTVNFLLQRFWVFRNPQLARHRTEVTGRYIFITLVDFVLDYLIVYGLKLAGVSPYVGQFISSGFFTFWNYIWYKRWVFTNRLHRKHKPHTPAASKGRRRSGQTKRRVV